MSTLFCSTAKIVLSGWMICPTGPLSSLIGCRLCVNGESHQFLEIFHILEFEFNIFYLGKCQLPVSGYPNCGRIISQSARRPLESTGSYR